MLVTLGACWGLSAAGTDPIATATVSSGGEPDPEIEKDQMPKTEDEWRTKLSPEQFRVLRQEGTEAAYAGQYLDHFEDGTYRCAGCGATLYDSKVKFRDGGWPNFEEALPGAVETKPAGFGAVEVHCARCKGHLGHIFNDGPGPTHKRH